MNENDILIEVQDNIEALRSVWKQLDAKAMQLLKSGELQYINYSFYQTYEWNEFLAHSYRHSVGNPQFVTVAVDGETRIILPLLVKKHKVSILSGRIAGILNAVCPYNDETTSMAMSELVAFLKHRFGKGWKVQLASMPRHSLMMETMVKRGSSCSERGSYHVPLNAFGSYDDYISSLGKNIYKNIRKSYNHLKSDNKEMKLDVYDCENSPSRQLLRQVWTLYFRRKLAWKHKSHSWLREIICKARGCWFAARGRQTKSMFLLKESRLFVFTINGELAAFMHVYIHEGHALMPKLAIDMSYSRYSPGIIMLLESLKLLMEQGVADFDMCRGDERYKMEVGGLMEPLGSVSNLC